MGNRYAILSGLGGGFGGMSFKSVDEYENLEDAMREAYESAIEEFDSYGGLHGLPSEESIAEDNDLDMEEDAEEINSMLMEEKESWIEYNAVLLPDDVKDEDAEEYVNNLEE